MKQPNILLIMTDEMRGDCVGVRHPDVKTPYLDTLIARGTYFPNAVTACPSCIAARAAVSAAICAANGVDFLEPRKPSEPALDQLRALP